MKIRLHVVLGAVLAVVVLVASGRIYVHRVTAAQLSSTSITLPARFSYAAKFVCGVSTPTTTQVPPSEPLVKTGNYATVINLHNPWATSVTLQKKVALAAPEQFPNTRLIDPTRRFQDLLASDHAMSIGCAEIVNLLTLNTTPPTSPFIEGWVVVDSYFTGTTNSAAAIDVTEVTTTAASPTASVNSHDVTVVPGRALPAGVWPF
jgi:hypothetical protein